MPLNYYQGVFRAQTVTILALLSQEPAEMAGVDIAVRLNTVQETVD